VGTDWRAWHLAYDEPDSSLARRLEVVRRMIGAWLDSAPAGRLRVISVCAGDGRDLLGALGRHPRRTDVTGTLVELDPGLAATARERADALGIDGLEVLVADAGAATTYDGVAPADLLMICGVFGNISADDIRATVMAAPALCADGATALWTRHRRAPDLTSSIRVWWREAGFDEAEFAPVPQSLGSVGREVLARRPAARPLPSTLFSFTGDGRGALR